MQTYSSDNAMKKLTIIAAFFVLAACAQLQNLNITGPSAETIIGKLATMTTADLARATEIATTEKDQSALVCLGQIRTVVGYATPIDNKPLGLFTAFEIARVIRRNGIIQDCAALIAVF
jgi:hypothetical protein